MSTLKNLVNETTNIKDEIITCYAELKNSLIDKGVEISDNDKLNDLIDKTSLINGSKYKLNVKVNVQEDEPQNPSYGDIWLPISDKDYKISFSPNNIENPTDKDLHIKASNMYVNFNLDESFDDFSHGLKNSFNINLITNSFEYNTSNSIIPILINGVSKIFAKIGVSRIWNSELNKWERVYGKYWDGEKWVGFTNDETILYIVNDGYLEAINLKTHEKLWTSSTSISKIYQTNVCIGYSTICVMNAPSSYSDTVDMYIFDFNGKLISKKTCETRLSSWYGSRVVYCKDGTFMRYYTATRTYFLKYSELTGELIASREFLAGTLSTSSVTGINIVDDILIVSNNGSRYIYAIDTNLQGDIVETSNSFVFNSLLVLKDNVIGLLYFSSNNLTLRRIKIDPETKECFVVNDDVKVYAGWGSHIAMQCANTINPNTLEDIILLVNTTKNTVHVFDLSLKQIQYYTMNELYYTTVVGYEGGNFMFACGSSSSYSNHRYLYRFEENDFWYSYSSGYKYYANAATSSGVIGTFDERFGL